MPWQPRVTKDQVAQAVADVSTWREVLEELDYAYHGKTIAMIRKWAARWGISTAHLTDNRGGTHRRVRYTETELREAVAASFSWAETLRRLGYCPTGGNWRTLQRRVALLGISVDHFDPNARARQVGRARRLPLEEILVEGSTFSRSHLKARLYEEGLKQRRCELCGQDEMWNGKRISLILDHINGVRNDHRLENLRITCPNCAAGLDTHCGRKNRLEAKPRHCLRCEKPFEPKYASQRYCSRYCGTRSRPSRSHGGGGGRRPGVPVLQRRKVERPPYRTLIEEVRQLGYSAVGRKYGVSDNAIRKWLRQYERERAVAEGRDPGEVEIPTRTWPNRKRPAQGGTSSSSISFDALIRSGHYPSIARAESASGSFWWAREIRLLAPSFFSNQATTGVDSSSRS